MRQLPDTENAEPYPDMVLVHGGRPGVERTLTQTWNDRHHGAEGVNPKRRKAYFTLLFVSSRDRLKQTFEHSAVSPSGA